MDQSFSFLSLALIFLRQKRRIFVHFVVVVAASVTLSYLIPKNYKATTLFLPPYSERSSGFPGISLSLTLDLGGESSFTAQQIETMIFSRRVTEATIRKFDLIKLYETDDLPNKTEKAIKILTNKMDLKTNTDAALTQKLVTDYALSVIDEDGVRAADMANFIIAELGRAMDEISRNQYQYSVKFIGNRLDSVAAAKSALQKKLTTFQKANKVYAPEMEKQVLASISIYAELRKERIVAELERNMLLFDRDKDSREVRFVERRISEIDKKLKSIEDADKPEVLPGLNNSVDIAYEYLDMTQQAEMLVKLDLLLRQQYEEARIRAARMAPTVRVIDPAVPPEWKNFPKKSIIVLAITGLYMFGLCLYILLGYGLSHASASTRARITEFREALRIRKR